MPQTALHPGSTRPHRGGIDAIGAVVREDMAQVDAHIRQHLDSDVALVRDLGTYLVTLGGKRLRPLTLLLSAGAFRYRGSAHTVLGAAIEFIHTATLLHDDVVDESTLRRGQPTAHKVWGNAASVLVGDFLYTRSFQMLVAADSMRVMGILADTTNAIAEGEVMQLMNCHQPDTTEKQYLETVQRKTAKLFESAARLGAVISDQPPSVEQAMTTYGLHLGIAFQLVDDALDYSADTDTLGKNIGDDLAEGKPTLPLIHAMRTGSAQQQLCIRRAIETGGLDHMEAILETIESTGALTYTSRLAGEHAERARNALNGIPESVYKQALLELTGFAVERDH